MQVRKPTSMLTGLLLWKHMVTYRQALMLTTNAEIGVASTHLTFGGLAANKMSKTTADLKKAQNQVSEASTGITHDDAGLLKLHTTGYAIQNDSQNSMTPNHG